MPYKSVADIRNSWGSSWADASDEEVLGAYAKAAKINPLTVANTLGYDPGKGSLTNERIASSADRYQANLYGLADAVTGSDWAKRGLRRNEFQADIASARARELGGVDDWRDVNGVGSGLNFVGGLAAQSLPYMGEALVGGIGARALMGGTRAALGAARVSGDAAAATRAGRALDVGSMVGATVAGYPSAVGDILSNQRDENGTTDAGAAFAGGVPYALLNGALGVEGIAARGLRGVGATGERMLPRIGQTALKTGFSEGASETGQELINQSSGRMAVNPDETLFNPEANQRYLDSFVGGAALGALGGGLSGIKRNTPEQQRVRAQETTEKIEAGQEGDLLTPAATNYPLTVQGDRSLATIPESDATERMARYTAPQSPLALPFRDEDLSTPNYDPNALVATANGAVGRAGAMSGMQDGLFGDYTFAQGGPSLDLLTGESAAPAPSVQRDDQTFNMFPEGDAPVAQATSSYPTQNFPFLSRDEAADQAASNPALAANVPGGARGSADRSGTDANPVASDIRSQVRRSLMQSMGNMAGNFGGFVEKLSLDLAPLSRTPAAALEYTTQQMEVQQKQLAQLDRKVSMGSNLIDPEEYAQKRAVIDGRVAAIQAAQTLFTPVAPTQAPEAELALSGQTQAGLDARNAQDRAAQETVEPPAAQQVDPNQPAMFGPKGGVTPEARRRETLKPVETAAPTTEPATPTGVTPRAPAQTNVGAAAIRQAPAPQPPAANPVGEVGAQPAPRASTSAPLAQNAGSSAVALEPAPKMKPKRKLLADKKAEAAKLKTLISEYTKFLACLRS